MHRLSISAVIEQQVSDLARIYVQERGGRRKPSQPAWRNKAFGSKTFDPSIRAALRSSFSDRPEARNGPKARASGLSRPIGPIIEYRLRRQSEAENLIRHYRRILS